MCTSSIHIANIAQTRHKPQLCRLFPKESVGLFRVFPIPSDPYPQRQQITGNTAGVEWGRMENTDQKGLSKGPRKTNLPQRQQIAENAAGAEWGRMENTAQGGLSKWALRDSFTTTAANHRKHCRCGMGPNGEYGSERLVEGGTARETYHNGSKSRETLPVWNGPNGEYGSERPVEGAAARQLYHNGSKSRETLPVW